MADNIGVNSGGATNIATDDVGGVQYQRVKLNFGIDATATDVSPTFPLPIREPARGAALAKGGATVSASNLVLTPGNNSRSVLEVSNAGASGLWLSFISNAIAGQGTYLPSKATGYWLTTATVCMILETGGSVGPVGYTEW